MVRNYSDKTLKHLGILSGNQCAHPQCMRTLIEPATEKSQALVTGQICHIYPISKDGPRGKSGLDQKELNSQENLIFLCRDHHAVVDGQHESYPVEMLKEWKQKHEQKMKRKPRLSDFPTKLVDQKIEEDIDILRKSRFFIEFDRFHFSLTLGKRLVEEELSGGTSAIRSWALAWCARCLSYSEHIDKAEEFINLAKNLEECPEISIADAFISSQKGDKSAALKTLASIDSSASRSSAFMIVAHHEGKEGAVNWLNAAGISAADLDSDGKLLLLTQLLQLSRWESARKTLAMISEQDLGNIPILHHIVAITYLLSTIPTELRVVALNQFPFNAERFPLASSAIAIDTQRKAHHHFINATKAAQKFNCSSAAIISNEYALWLELKDPQKYDEGIRRLESEFRNSKFALRLVRLGLQFGVNVDLVSVEKAIEQEIALHGGMTKDAAIACFSLAFTQKNPEDAASYIDDHYDDLSEHFDGKMMRFTQIDILAQAELPEKANEYLQILLKDGLSESEESYFKRIISEAKGTDLIENRKVQFEQTDSLVDLYALVEELEKKEKWDDLSRYGGILFERTNTVRDAVRLADALFCTHKTKQLVEFLKAHIEFLAQSPDLRILYCWSLYYEGALLEARSELMKLNDNLENQNHRHLQVCLGIALGDWHSLSAFVMTEFSQKENRSAESLIEVAQLALNLGLPCAKELVLAAADKGNNDANVLAKAYTLSSNAGWEVDAEAGQWFHKSVELSGSDGPFQKMALKDILNQKPEWDRRESETWRRVVCGEIPMFLAAYSLNRTLIDMMLFPALANLEESDPRRRSAIAAYSGKRQPMQLDTGGTVGLDATTLLTLSFLNLLDKGFDAFDMVYVSHSTLGWLFEGKQKTTFHQPSRIKDAHQVRDFLARDVLDQFAPSVVADSDLSDQVGDELAMLIAEAEKITDDNTQCLVVRAYPVHRITSLLEEEADLTVHDSVMSSCLSIVEQLREKGQITAEEERNARAYLSLHEKPWPHQPEINAGAILYLDSLTVKYFLHIGILEKMHAAGFKLIVSSSIVSESNELISYESMSDRVNEAIERIRYAVSSRIKSTKIKVGSIRNIDKSEGQSILQHATANVITLANECDKIVVDDRFINQHLRANYEGSQASIFSTLDLIDMLVSIDSITSEDRLEYRTTLRRAGYFFVPVNDDELTVHLGASQVKDNKVSETAELKAIRENILHVRMNNWLQFPEESLWLDTVFGMFGRSLKNLWMANVDLSNVIARSNWIVEQVDIRGWSHRLKGESGDNIVKTGRSVQILMLLEPPSGTSQDIRDKYWNWMEGRILAPIKEQYPDLYAWIVEWQRKQISQVVDMKLKELRHDNSPYVKLVLAQIAWKLVPPLIQKSLLKNQAFIEEYGFEAALDLVFGDSGISIQRSKFFNAVREILSSGESEIQIIDIDDRKWKINKVSKEGELPTLAIHGSQYILLPDFSVLSSERSTRLRSFDEADSKVNLPINTQDMWRNLLSKRALDDNEVDEFHRDLRDTPIHVEQSIFHDTNRPISIPSLVPPSRRYFERLAGAYDGSASIRDYATECGRKFFEKLSAWRSYDGFLFNLLLSSHSALTAEISIKHLRYEDLVRAFDFLEKYGDRISQLGAIEVGLRVLPERPEIEPVLIRLIKQIRDDDVDEPASGFNILSALFILVDGELSRLRLLPTEPPFYRRLVSLSQAALIHRKIVNSRIDIDPLYDWAMNSRGMQYYVQSLADTRLEPRWNPNQTTASQMKADCLVRIIITARKYEKNINAGELHDLIFSTENISLSSLIKIPYSYLPGPLSENENSQNIFPTEFSDAIKTQLGAEEVGPSSFVALVNSALLFPVESDQAELAAGVLKRSKYRLANVKDRSELLAILNGLARVSAVTRSHSLADELRILIRRYRHDAQYTFPIDEILEICLVAAASRVELHDWREFVGNWLTELAFDDLSDDDGKILDLYLQHLCHAVPELWVSCGRADAALKAFCAR